MNNKGPYVAIVLAVIALVVGIEMGATVIEQVDDVIDSTSSGTFSLTGTIAPFVPVVYLAGIMGLSGLIAVVGGVVTARDVTSQIILSVIAVVIGISLTNTVVTAATNVDTAITNANATFTLADTINPFVPVIYIASVLALASLPWINRIRGMRGG